MKEAHFEYKCRRCGEIRENPHTGLSDGESRAIALLLDAMTDNTKELGAPTMLSLHSCKDGGTGVSDLLGYNITGK